MGRLSEMLGEVHDVIQAAAVAMEVAAVAFIIIGSTLAVLIFLKEATAEREGLRRAFPWWFPEKFPQQAYERFRVELGHTILFGLELLIAAEIIHTAAAQTFRSLGLVAGIVAVRTVLALILTVEVDRRWPWQRTESEEVVSPSTRPRRIDAVPIAPWSGNRSAR
jgi:uncharacterized membrane protein